MMKTPGAPCSILETPLSGLTWLGHSTVVIDVDGTRLVTDPVLRRRVFHLRRAAAIEPGALGALDGILVSHSHFDHLDVPSLSRLPRSLSVVCPTGIGQLLRRRGFEQVHEVGPGEIVEVGGREVRATHAEHRTNRRPFAGRSAALGYVVEGSKNVYFAGDTELFDGMADLGPIDVALLPVSGWGPRMPAGHLEPRSAAEALLLLRPKVAVPVHWGTFRAPFGPRLDDRAAREFASAAARLAPEVEVCVLQIGETLPLEEAH
jgi:L-ascorbate metabolism protein UlaG (beta-lactamase superfamily)